MNNTIFYTNFSLWIFCYSFFKYFDYKSKYDFHYQMMSEFFGLITAFITIIMIVNLIVDEIIKFRNKGKSE